MKRALILSVSIVLVAWVPPAAAQNSILTGMYGFTGTAICNQSLKWSEHNTARRGNWRQGIACEALWPRALRSSSWPWPKKYQWLQRTSYADQETGALEVQKEAT
jgi:hypothetical protein